MRRRIGTALLALTLSTAIVPLTAPIAQAQFFGGVVFDPTNYGQNLLTAANTLKQIKNQIVQLQNEAQMLVNDAKNLTRVDINISDELVRILREISGLTDRAKAISYKIEETDRVFQENYPEEYETWSNTKIAEAAEFQWVTSRNSLHDTLLMQSQIVQTIQSDTSVLDSLVDASHGTTGHLGAAQVGNQILALSVQQEMQIQELMAAQFRAESLERARRLQIEREGKIRTTRFMGSRSAYDRSGG